MKINLAVILFFCSTSLFAQELKELRHWTTRDHSADFYISMEDKRVKFSDTLDYYWYKSQAIHVTQGYAGGNLLNGPFTKFYVSGQLAERGEFELGLRVGEWKTWFESGQLASIFNYDEGVLDGNYFMYDESGNIVESGNFRDGKYHGEKTENGEVTKYRNGKEKKRKEKAVKEDDVKTEEGPKEEGWGGKEKKWRQFLKKKGDDGEQKEEPKERDDRKREEKNQKEDREKKGEKKEQ